MRGARVEKQFPIFKIYISHLNYFNKMRQIITLAAILGYLIGSIVIGYGQHKNFGDLSTTYLITQWVVLGISAFCTLRFQNSYTKLGDTLATLGGGIAMMVIIQAVIFFFLGGLVKSNMSNGRIIVLVILAIIIVRLVYKYLTKYLR